MTDRPPGPPEPPQGWIPLGPQEPTGPPEPPQGWIPLGSDQTPPPPPPPGPLPSPPPRSPRWPLPLLGLVIVAGGLAAFLLLRDDGPSHPADWDVRVQPLAEFVELERGLLFEHPVRVEFLDEEAWRERGAIDEEELLAEDAQLLEHGEGIFRAVGLAEGDFDLLGDSQELGTSGTVGLYQFDDERISVRGDTLTTEVKATLVHELTHALQDQHFDIGERLQHVAEETDPAEGSLRVVVEGDADRIEDLWIESLSDEERAALDEEQAATGDAAAEALEALPSSLIAFFASDYILGAGFMDVLEAADGTGAIDEAFRSPPDPDEHVLDPISYLEDDLPNEVDPPDVAGEAIADLDGDFGAVSWFLMLAERTDPVAVLAAVDGWGGDSYRAYTDDDRTCVALRFRGEDDAAASAMHAVVSRWVAAMPATADASVELMGDVVDLVTCDPGPDADLLEGTGRSRETISLLATRSALAAEVLDGGGTNEQARCFSRGLIAKLDYEILVADDATAEQQQRIQQAATDEAIRCR